MVNQSLGGKYWVHTDECGVPYDHVHFGDNLVMRLDDEASVPPRVAIEADAFYAFHGRPWAKDQPQGTINAGW